MPADFSSVKREKTLLVDIAKDVRVRSSYGGYIRQENVMDKALDQMTSTELSEALEDLDSVISADQHVVAGAKKRLNLHYRLRESILDLLASQAMRKGW